MLKIIEDYSKSNETKSKEIESLNSKLDRKVQKISELKKTKSENEVKITKLRGTLDNMKTFLKLLNTNFLKSMKQQNSYLKEQYLENKKEFIKEIENLKENMASQTQKILVKREKELLS